MDGRIRCRSTWYLSKLLVVFLTPTLGLRASRELVEDESSGVRSLHAHQQDVMREAETARLLSSRYDHRYSALSATVNAHRKVLLSNKGTHVADGHQHVLNEEIGMSNFSRHKVGEHDITMASLFLEKTWSILPQLLTVKNIAQAGLDVYNWGETFSNFDLVASNATSQLTSLLSQLSKGEVQSKDVTRSQYFELQRLRKDLSTIESFCVGKGLLANLWVPSETIEMREKLQEALEFLQSVLDKLLNSFFCEKLGDSLSQEMNKFARLMSMYYGTSDSDRQFSLKDFEGKIDQDEMDHLKSSMELIKMLFGEMAAISDSCRNRAVALRCLHADSSAQDTSECRTALETSGIVRRGKKRYKPLCSRCSHCCALPRKASTLEVWVQDVMNKYQATLLTIQDVSSVGFAAWTGCPASIAWISARLVTRGNSEEHDELCEAAYDMVTNIPVPGQIAEEVQEGIASSKILGDTLTLKVLGL